MPTTGSTPASSLPFITSDMVGTWNALPNSRSLPSQNSGFSKVPRAILISLLVSRGWSKNSCIGSHDCSIKCESATAWQDRLLYHLPQVNGKRTADTVTVKSFPMFLNSKEEIGWKVQLQNSNLWQEVAWPLPNKRICAPNWNNAASACTRLCIRQPPMLLFLNC